jgi:GntR family transcriptional regulator
VVTLDKQNPTPLYYQLQKIIKEDIEGGVYQIGDIIPTEKELMQVFDISRSTVRQAVLTLVNEGYLKREKSKGTIVISQTGRSRFIGGLISFTEEMNRRQIPHSSIILDKKIISAGNNIAEKLAIQKDDLVYLLKRLRFVRQQPFLIDEHYIPYVLCPGIEEEYHENSSLYLLLRTRYHLNLHHGQIEFEVLDMPSDEVAELLEVKVKVPLLKAERIVYSNTNVPLDYFTAITCGKFSVDVSTD